MVIDGITVGQTHAIRPTVMREFIRCPYRAKLLRDGWRGPVDWNRDLLMWMGTAVAAGAEKVMTARKDGLDPSVTHTITESLRRQWIEPPRVTQWGWDRALVTCQGAVAAITERFTCTGPDVVAVEYESGAGKPDLIYRHDSGRLRVVDWKCHRRVIPDLSYYDYDWQMWHYVWLARELYHETPERIEVVNIFFEPRIELVVHEIVVTDERIDEWMEQAKHQWAKARVPQEWNRKNWVGCHVPYWPCEFIPICHYGASLDTIYRSLDAAA